MNIDSAWRKRGDYKQGHSGRGLRALGPLAWATYPIDRGPPARRTLQIPTALGFLLTIVATGLAFGRPIRGRNLFVRSVGPHAGLNVI